MVIIPILFGIFLVVYCTYLYLRFNPEDIRFDTETVKIYDKDNTILWELSKDNAVRNTRIEISEVPQFCKDSLISIEDKNFYENIGVDFGGVARLIVSALSGGSLGGGSTISQQVIKNSHGTFYDRNALDKINEIILSIKLNRVLNKDKILELYLNNVYFGQLNYGIESAAQDYFGKTTSQLNEAECSYLMGIPQFPGVYNPYGDIESGIERQQEVLNSMIRNNLIGEQKSNEIMAFPLEFKFTGYSIRAPHYIEYVQKKYGIFQKDGFESVFSGEIPEEISTSYDYELHTKILNLLAENAESSPDNASAFVISKYGEILTMIGSKDYFNDEVNGKFNSALGLRQPGTLYNPLIYSYALQFHNPEERYPNLSFSKDVERGINEFETVRVSNFGQNDSLNSKIIDSLNSNLTVPAVRIIQEYEPYRIQNYLVELGIPEQTYDNWCNEILNLEGCESTLVDVTLALSNVINPQRINLRDIESYKVSDNQLVFKQEVPESFIADKVNDTVLKPEIFTKYIVGHTVNQKDFWLYFYNQDFFAGFWFGNTEGDPIKNYDSFVQSINIEKIIQTLEENI